MAKAPRDRMQRNPLTRRQTIMVLGSAAVPPVLFRPAAARAQPAKPLYTIGVLALTSPDPAPLLKALREGLHDVGYDEGRNLRLEVRVAPSTPDLQLEKAAELVRLKVDLIVTFFTPTALAAKQATGEIPIVMAGAGDPVATGIVPALARRHGPVERGCRGRWQERRADTRDRSLGPADRRGCQRSRPIRQALRRANR